MNQNHKHKKIQNHKHKKISKKKEHLISLDLITNNQFKKILDTTVNQSRLTLRDQYLYGYSLAHSQRHAEALIYLWPLVIKGNTALKEDCQIIAGHIFKDPTRLSSMTLSDDQLYTLFRVAQALFPESEACYLLKKRFYSNLWKKHEYENLETIIKSLKEKTSSVFIENIGKLTFAQAEKKVKGNIPVFIGKILSGATSLILRDSIFHHDIENIIQALSHEIKHSSCAHALQHSSSSMTLFFNKLLDFESSILINILQCLIKNKDHHFDWIPTPSYFAHCDVKNQEMYQPFLSWMARENKELYELYQPDLYQSVILSLNPENPSPNNSILSPAYQSKLHPYLQLIWILRFAKNHIPPIFDKLLSSETTCHLLKNSTHLFKTIFIESIKCMIDHADKKPLSNTFWPMLTKIYHISNDIDIQKLLKKRLFELIHQNTPHENNAIYERNMIHEKDEISFDFDKMIHFAREINSYDIEQSLIQLQVRQQYCLLFMSTLETKKKSTSVIKKIKTETELRTHLTLIVDSCFFMPDFEDTAIIWEHTKQLISNKRINQFIPLKNILQNELKCFCPHHLEQFVTMTIPSLAIKLQLPTVCLPTDHSSKPDEHEQSSSNVVSYPKINLENDPFSILDVSTIDTKSIIMQKTMKLIQLFPEKMSAFRQAQNALFQPAQRFLYQYFYYFSYETNEPQPINCFSFNTIFLRHELLDDHS